MKQMGFVKQSPAVNSFIIYTLPKFYFRPMAYIRLPTLTFYYIRKSLNLPNLPTFSSSMYCTWENFGREKWVNLANHDPFA